MPTAISIRCKVVSKLWLTPTVLQLRFEPSKKISFEPGQFLSVKVPSQNSTRPLRRIYSFSSAPGSSAQGEYELCIKNVDGPGTRYLCSLNVGEEFDASAPYGDFFYETSPGRSACFISTGTGIAPFKSMVHSRRFAENPPDSSLMLYGARTEDEIIYPTLFQGLGIEVVNAISRPSAGFAGFRGRVTDFIKQLPVDWQWDTTDFYLCGSGDMVAEVRRILRAGRNVAETAIFQEVYFSTHAAGTPALPAASVPKTA